MFGANRAQKKERRPRPLPNARQGAYRTAHDRRPLAGARIKSLLLYERSLSASVWRFWGSSYLTLARQFKM